MAWRPASDELRPAVSAPPPGWTPAVPATPLAPRVVIVNDSLPTRLGLRALLEEAGFEVCGQVPDAASAAELVERELPELCLLEIKIAGDGIEAIENIIDAAPATAIVVLTSSHDERDVLRALRAGAAAYVLLDDADSDSLAHALRTILCGNSVLPRGFLPALAGGLGARRQRLRTDVRGGLTSREQEILQLLVDGLTTAEIARRLFVSQVTVRTHICSILKKLEVRDRESAVRLARPADDQPG